MAALQPVRGTRDILPPEMRAHRRVADLAREVAERYGFEEMATPIFEFRQVFERTLGDATDIVTKEMYSFTDRGGDQITLRPENTAGVARAFISGGLAQNVPLKFYYTGPMFRYERPQKGRLRQFHQIGVELLGVADAQADVEVIACAARILDELGILEKVELELNTLGDGESRALYRDVLVGHMLKYRDRLSPESVERLNRNPLRILDSKDPRDRDAVAEAPPMTSFLNASSKSHFEQVCCGLDALGIQYRLNERLVRGLDYYCHSAFEFTTTALGSQGAVIAGGRYDGLIGAMGGPETPGIGWAGGVERLAMLAGDPPPARRPVAIVPIGDAPEDRARRLAEDLRRQGFCVDLGYGGNLGRRMKRANRVNAIAAVLLGEDELQQGAATIREMDTGQQRQVSLAALAEALAPYR